jgi:hypothetical protein
MKAIAANTPTLKIQVPALGERTTMLPSGIRVPLIFCTTGNRRPQIGYAAIPQTAQRMAATRNFITCDSSPTLLLRHGGPRAPSMETRRDAAVACSSRVSSYDMNVLSSFVTFHLPFSFLTV